MQKNLNSNPSLELVSTAAVKPSVRNALIELDMSQFKHVSGGSPKGTWESMSTVIASPKGTW